LRPFGGGWRRRWCTLRSLLPRRRSFWDRNSRWDGDRIGSLGNARRLWKRDFGLALLFGSGELNFNLLGESGFGILNLCSDRELSRRGFTFNFCFARGDFEYKWCRWWLGNWARPELRVF